MNNPALILKVVSYLKLDDIYNLSFTNKENFELLKDYGHIYICYRIGDGLFSTTNVFLSYNYDDILSIIQSEDDNNSLHDCSSDDNDEDDYTPDCNYESFCCKITTLSHKNIKSQYTFAKLRSIKKTFPFINDKFNAVYFPRIDRIKLLDYRMGYDMVSILKWTLIDDEDNW